MSNIPNKKLSNGLEMPYVGLGTYKVNTQIKNLSLFDIFSYMYLFLGYSCR